MRGFNPVSQIAIVIVLGFSLFGCGEQSFSLRNGSSSSTQSGQEGDDLPGSNDSKVTNSDIYETIGACLGNLTKMARDLGISRARLRTRRPAATSRRRWCRGRAT